MIYLICKTNTLWKRGTFYKLNTLYKCYTQTQLSSVVNLNMFPRRSHFCGKGCALSFH